MTTLERIITTKSGGRSPRKRLPVTYFMTPKELGEYFFSHKGINRTLDFFVSEKAIGFYIVYDLSSKQVLRIPDKKMLSFLTPMVKRNFRIFFLDGLFERYKKELSSIKLNWIETSFNIVYTENFTQYKQKIQFLSPVPAKVKTPKARDPFKIPDMLTLSKNDNIFYFFSPSGSMLVWSKTASVFKPVSDEQIPRLIEKYKNDALFYCSSDIVSAVEKILPSFQFSPISGIYKIHL